MQTSSALPPPSLLLGTAAQSRDFVPLLRWLLVMGLTGFGIALLWQVGVIQALFRTDRTRISSLILALFALTSLHCLVQTWFVSRELSVTRAFRDRLRVDRQGGAFDPGGSAGPPDSVIARHVENLIAKARTQGGRRIDQTLLLRALAERLRSRERLGWFVSEALLRLALLGTAVGFILMLLPLTGLSTFDAETSRRALSGMSSGMAIALNVTVTGIATALLLKLQYFFLGTSLVDLVDMITEVTEVHVVSALERQADG